MPMDFHLTTGDLQFVATLRLEQAPKTCQTFISMLPLHQRFIHVRWSGEAIWIPFGDVPSEVGFEDPTSYPAPGELLFYPGGISEMEILLAYGPTRFASKAGQLAGNHFATVTRGQERLKDLGRRVLWQGAQDALFELL